jgi:hypothetical protein
LFASFVIKLTFIIVEIALAIAFGVLGRKGSTKRNAAAVLEWGTLYKYSDISCGAVLANSDP